VLLNGGALKGAGQLQTPSIVSHITLEQQSFGQSFGGGVGRLVGIPVGRLVGALVGQQVVAFSSSCTGPKQAQTPRRLSHLPFPQQFNGQGITFRLQSQVILNPKLSTAVSVGIKPVPSFT
jgi:hypothetical protein